tara:strand:+ start:642 stop:1433 length:792 start_codon:yes stop_codon:yes gene_type:complete
MIGYNHLGKNGRLANQMFQYATTRGIAASKGYDFAIPPSDFQDQWNDHQLFSAFKLSSVKNIGFINGDYYKEPDNHSHIHLQEFVDNCPDNVSLYGYFQTEKYFKHISDEIREDFTFKDDILDPCKEAFDFTDAISLHVRRSDYLLPQHASHHGLCSLEYYQSALSEFDEELPVLIFSDDPDWCEEQEIFQPDRFLISRTNDNLMDMCLMTMCNHHIIANSSFSWWGAWLADSKNVIAPTQWYGPAGAHLSTQDLYPTHWKNL